MTTAILPLRALHDGKRRLQAVLSAAERTALVQGMLLRVVTALHDSRCVEQVVVVSPDELLLAWAMPHGVAPVRQPGDGLNAGLAFACGAVRSASPHAALLIMLPDLPLLQASEVAGLVQAGASDTVVLAPDRHGAGTNALWLPPAVALPFAFGPHSLGQHMAAAEARGLWVRQFHSAGTAFDLDTAEDLDVLHVGGTLR